MPQAPMPNSAGQPQPDNAGGQGGGQFGYLPQGKPGGEIIISRAEAAALTAFESDEDENEGLTRARKESGLTADQLRRLKTRAENLRGKGYTLKSERTVFKPKNYEQPDTSHGLIGDKELGDDSAASEERRKLRAKLDGVKDPEKRKQIRARMEAQKKRAETMQSKPAAKAREAGSVGSMAYLTKGASPKIRKRLESVSRGLARFKRKG